MDDAKLLELANRAGLYAGSLDEIDTAPEEWARLVAKEARAAALEEAAKVCEAVGDEDPNTDSYHWYGCSDCAAAIRALKTSPPETPSA